MSLTMGRPAAPLVTASQMRDLEAAAVAAGVSERELMANAGLAVAQEAWMMAGGSDERAILILVGPGNNGGDGLVAATRLAQWGAPVHAYLLRPRTDDDLEWRACIEAGVPHTVATEDKGFATLEELLSTAAVAVDALFGTGLHPQKRPIDGDAAQVLARLQAARASAPAIPLLAVDLPSGVDSDTGFADPLATGADETVTFECAKVGLVTSPGSLLAGRVVPVEIGVPAAARDSLGLGTLTLREVRAILPERPADGHKGTFGTTVIAAGSRRYPGAARLATESAARSGCGVVTLAAPASIQPLLVAFADATHEPLPDLDGSHTPEGARALLQALRRGRARSLLVGPGIGLSDAARGFVQHLLAGLDAVEGLETVIFDADALTVLAGESGWHTRFAAARVLTPHPGEMARLLGRSVEAVQATRLATALEAAAATGSVVILKGAGTVIASPDGRARISEVGTSALAHGGTGDVLAGLVAGFAAQGLPGFEAACAAVWVHAEAARQVSAVYGDAGTLASDLIRALPEARKALEPPRRDDRSDRLPL
ncbi:MAG: NAD(P)H-hydrate dehydratase [Dehalococcoidia bacterium]|nr:MAG: NAD(P)H-hydrate dehydratase [Dehalococcoidia bacterium]